MEEIFHSRPSISGDDVDAVNRVLATSMLAQGPLCQELEQRLSSWFGADGAVAVGSGAAALVLALHSLGIGRGDEVILPTYVCAAVLEAVLSVDAVPVLCDVGESWVMTSTDAARCVSGRTRAIIAPHMYGIFSDIASLRPLGVPIIEDCAQAVGAEGTQHLAGDIAVLSFHPTKCLTSGEGGIAISSDPDTLGRMRTYRDGGGGEFSTRLFSPISDIAAALAISQANRYGEMLRRRKEIAQHYTNVLERCAPDSLNRTALRNSMFFRFPVRIKGGLESCQIAFRQRGIHVRRGVDVLLHRKMQLSDYLFPTAVELFKSTVSIPIYPALSQEQELRCVDAMKHVFANASNLLRN